MKGGDMCDNWVQTVLKAAGVSIKEYFKGDAVSFTCEEHIAAMKNEGHISSTTGKPLAAHTGFLVIGDGNPYFIDNSSGNYNGSGGVEKTYGKYFQTPQAVMSRFGYDAFYYKKVQ